MPLSTFLNGRGYETLRGAAFLALSDVGHLVSGTVTSDGGGGGTTVWSAGTADIPCRVDAIGGSEALTAGRIDESSTHVIVIPSGTDIDEKDRFAIEGRGTFVVTAISERTSETFRTLAAAGV